MHLAQQDAMNRTGVMMMFKDGLDHIILHIFDFFFLNAFSFPLSDEGTEERIQDKRDQRRHFLDNTFKRYHT